jgi:hypoxanthine phosphoribosyltransferase|tara:strand:- start:233 stop:640 length:408 start_codon:yes stop_codon:yes gene_type:complete
MSKKVYISWEGYDSYIDSITNWVKTSDLNLGAVYGLPRGGLPIAVSLSHRLHLPLLMDYYDRKIVTDKKILVVDDIADTGHTLKDFENKHNIICTFHYHEQSIIEPDYWIHKKDDDWIVYPWELNDSDEIQDYLK